MSTLQVNTIQTNTPEGVLAVRDANDALTAIQPSAVRGTAAATAPVFQDSAGTPIGTLCRAWVNFDGGLSTPTIRASFNVSSITDGGTGIYTLNFTTAMPDVNYCVNGTTIAQVLSSLPVRVTAKQSALTTTSCLIRVCSGNQDGPNTVGGYSDADSLFVTIFR
jgi:hypothetical protein